MAQTLVHVEQPMAQPLFWLQHNAASLALCGCFWPLGHTQMPRLVAAAILAWVVAMTWARAVAVQLLFTWQHNAEMRLRWQCCLTVEQQPISRLQTARLHCISLHNVATAVV